MISYDKKNKRYLVAVSVHITKGKSIRKWGSAKTAKDAKALEAKMTLEGQVIEEDTSVTLDTAFDSWCDWMSDKRRQTTIEKYQTIYRIHIQPIIGHIKVDAVNYAVLAHWKGKVRKDLSVGMKNHAYDCLHAFLNYVDTYFKTDLVRDLNKVGLFRDDPNKVTEKEVKLHYWKPFEFDSVISSLREHCEALEAVDYHYMPNWATYVMLNVLFYAGLRRGEANALTIGDFHDGVNPYLDITKSLTFKAKEKGWLITDPKNKKSIRQVPIPQRLADILREHISIRLQRLPIPYTDRIFLVGGIRPLADQTCDSIKNREEKRTQTEHIRVHELRHSYASCLISNGVPISTISALMGHANETITWNVYSHLYPKTLTDAVSIFDRLDCGNNLKTLDFQKNILP